MCQVLRCLSAILLALAAGCATISGKLPAPEPVAGNGAFLAGASRADITPPPGFPLGGHSMAARVSRGQWSRLYARAIYLQDASGRQLALIAAELWSIPGGLTDRVAELVAQGPAGCRVRREAIVLAATHTHQSPGNFSSSVAYNVLASPKIGFDPALFEFLARSIAGAVTAACAGREPASVELATIQVPLLMRNRSYPAFLRNSESGGILKENAALPLGDRSDEYPKRAAFRAVDPRIHLLKIMGRAPPSRELARVSFLGMHPTGMSHDSEVYSGDVFGIAAALAEQRLRSAGNGKAVVVIFNGAEGDISPYWRQQGPAAARELGGTLANALLRAEPFTPLGAPDIDFRYTRSSLPDQCHREPPMDAVCTSATALIGVATAGGAEDGRTDFYRKGWVEGIVSPVERDPRHAPKQPAFDPRSIRLPELLSPTYWVSALLPTPRDVPLGVYRLGDVVLTTLPGEFTMTMGRRIREAVAVEFDPRPHAVVLVGLANEYISYFTTPEEYSAQHYEGASTLYGGASGSVILHKLAELAQAFRRPPPPDPPAGGYRYAAGLRWSFEPPVDSGAVTFPGEFLNGPASWPTYCWREPYMSLATALATGGPVTPRVSMEQNRAGRWSVLHIDGVAETDEGPNFVSVARRTRAGDLEWCSLWLRADAAGITGELRFRVDGRDGARCGPGFVPGQGGGSAAQRSAAGYPPDCSDSYAGAPRAD